MPRGIYERTTEHRLALSLARKGKHYSPATEFKKGQHPSPKTEFTKENTSNEKHYCWKGDKVQYRALHTWISKNKPKPECCEECNKVRKLELSSINHTYERDIDKIFRESLNIE